jgi:putative transposase
MSSKYHDIFEPDNFYHIYNRSINKEKIFSTERHCKYFLSQWKKYFSKHLDVFTYCLLPDHYHFFVRVKEDSDNSILEDLFKRFLSSYSLAFNKENKRTGSLFQKRFKRKKVDNEVYFTRTIHYIHNNPIHHDYVKNYDEWKFSSYSSILSERPTLICRNEVLSWFGSKEMFVRFHEQNIVYKEIKDLLLEM